MPARRTIILLCAKRSGSTAMFNMFQRHPEVGVCHTNQAIELWEPNFWNFGGEAIAGRPDAFSRRFAESHPFLGGGAPRSEEELFAMWDAVLDHLGPIVFDKSPRYLGDHAALDLILRYRARGNDVRFVALVRDPRDVIASQFTLWSHLVDGDSPRFREERWVAQYEHLHELQRDLCIPLVRYEDFAAAPAVFAPILFEHCGLGDAPETYAHIRPVNVGRHATSDRVEIQSWIPGEKLRGMMQRFGYRLPAVQLIEPKPAVTTAVS
jgi:hypothetical protein